MALSHIFSLLNPPPEMEFSINFGIDSISFFFTLTHFFQTVNRLL